MKKRFASLLLALLMCLSAPLTAWAVSYVPPTEIGAVTVELTAPRVGEAADYTARVDADAPYYATSVNWTKVSVPGSSMPLGRLYGQDTFEQDSWYLATVSLQADFGYQFGSSVTAAVEGAWQTDAMSAGSLSSIGSLSLFAWFKVGDAPETAEEISPVEVSAVPETAEVGSRFSDWEERILAQAQGSGDFTVISAGLYQWTEGEDSSCWEACSFLDDVADGPVYAILLTLRRDGPRLFSTGTLRLHQRKGCPDRLKLHR